MSLAEYTYKSTIKNICIAFGDVFNNITVKKYDTSANATQSYTVPITFGPVDKFYQIRKEAKQSKSYDLQLPRLAYTLDGITYDPDRAQGANKIREFWSETLGLSNIDNVFTDPTPSPYNLEMTLYIRTNSIGQFAQIVENILPNFSPEISLRLKEFSYLNIERNLTCTLNGSVAVDMGGDQAENERREINGTMSFTIKAWMYFPFSSASIIKIIQSRYYIDEATSGTPTSATAYLANGYDTSGFWKTSAGVLSGTPVSGYDFSGYTSALDLYHFTSATDWDDNS